MERKNIKWLPAVLACLSLSVLAAPAVKRPVDILVSDDSQARVMLSNLEPNLLVVPGDKIIAVDSAQGIFINNNRALGQANGGVLLMTAQTKPFTFYLHTEGGLTVSVVGIPQKRDGRVVHFVSDRPVHHEATRRWERSRPYVRMLTDIHKAVLSGKAPEGFSQASVAALPAFSLPALLTLTAAQMWSGGALRLYRLDVRNDGTVSLKVSERLFQAFGVRSVMIFPYRTTLAPGAQLAVWVTVSEDGERLNNGQH